MQFAPSICQQCSVGCNISPGERYGELRRIENRFHGALNHYFLCDRGRFGYGYVNQADRPRQPLLRDGNDKLAITVDGALNRAADALRTACRHHRHRLAARLAREQLRPARAGGRRQLLRRR